MGPNSAAKAAQFAAPREGAGAYSRRVTPPERSSCSALPMPAPTLAQRRGRTPLHAALAAVLCLAALAAGAQPSDASVGLDEATLQRIRELGALAGAQVGAALSLPQLRVQVEPGALNPRLRLAPCQRIEPYLPPGVRAWGRSRIGLRCVEGPTNWNVYLLVTVQVFAPAWVLSTPLAAGSVLQAAQLQRAEVDWAAAATAPLADAAQLVGRQLARALPAGAPVRAADLRQRQWFAAGDSVQLVARGKGFSVGARAQAMGPGIEGRPVRVRTDNGRVLSGLAVGQNRVEVAL